MIITSAPRRALLLCAALLAGSLAGTAAPAPADGPPSPSGDPAISEKGLRALETDLIGPSHAAAHAAQRAVLRNPRERARLARTAQARSRGARAAAATDVARDGRWSAPSQLPTVAIHTAMLSTGKVLIFGQGNQVALWDPATNASRSVDPPRAADGRIADIFCAGPSFLADGRLLMTGGTSSDVGPNNEGGGADTEFAGINTVFIFDPLTEKWSRQPEMRQGRWYPTQVLLPDGRTAILDGRDGSGTPGAPHNNDVEIFTPSPDRDKPGTITQLGRRSGAGEPPAGGLYPHTFTMPSGRTLVAGPEPADSWFLNGLGAGLSLSWSDIANPLTHMYGTGVILPQDAPGSSEIALIGGDTTSGSGKEVETFDERQPDRGWTRLKDLNEPRGHANTVLLPNGSMVTVGGGYGSRDGRKDLLGTANLGVELWDPTTRTWRRGAAQQEGRAYHSTALLLPDGRVMSAGDDTNGGKSTDTAEVYSPPFLFDADGSAAARPVVGSAPEGVGYGSSFSVGFSGTDVAKAVLIAPGAVTHANDMSQRHVPLTVTPGSASSATLAAPANANHAPPGRYMLFLINSRGVPSEARFIQVDGRAATTVSPGGAGARAPGVATPAPAPSAARRGSMLNVSTVKGQKLSSIRRRGLRVTTRCRRTCTVRAQLRLDRRTARRLRIVRSGRGSSTVLIGRGGAKVRAGRTGRLTVRLTPTARRRLARTRTIEVEVRLTARDSAMSEQTVTRRLTLRR